MSKITSDSLREALDAALTEAHERKLDRSKVIVGIPLEDVLELADTLEQFEWAEEEYNRDELDAAVEADPDYSN